MIIFQSDILIYASCIFLTVIIPVLLLNSYLTEEDSYQAQKGDGGKIVSKLIKSNTTSISILEKKITKFVESYNTNCKYNNYISKHIYNWIFSDVTKYNEINGNDNYNCHYKILLDASNTIYFQFKHKFIGGAYIRDLASTLIDTEQIPNNKFHPHSSFFNITYLAKLLYNYRTIPKINVAEIEKCGIYALSLPYMSYSKRVYKAPILLRLVNSPLEIRRYISTYTIDRIDNVNNTNKNTPSSRITIIFNALKTLHKVLAINRPIICYLPIAFNHVKGINNNIGIMLIDCREDDTINTFNKRFEDNKYMVLATNFLLVNNLHKLGGYNGSSVRNIVDVVLTSTYYACDDNDKESRLHWSYENVGDYPIYLAISSCIMKNKIVVAQTITSNAGEIKLPTEYEPVNYEYFIPK
jgi:hypothetical protein